MNNDKWKWISLTFIICTLLWCLTIMVVNDNPFEIGLKADNNSVEISKQFTIMTNNLQEVNSLNIECQTKLSFYNKTHGDYWE